MFDFGDVPEDRKIYPEQEKRLNDARPAWLKQSLGATLGRKPSARR